VLHVVHAAAVEEQTDADEGGTASEGSEQECSAAAALGGCCFESKSHADAHYPHEPREHEVGDCEAVPGAVIEEPVAAAAVIDEYHDGEAHASEGVEGEQAAAAFGARLGLLQNLESRFWVFNYEIRGDLSPAQRSIHEIDGEAADDYDEDHDENRRVGRVGGDEVDEEGLGRMVRDVVEGGDVDAARFNVQTDLCKVLQFFDLERVVVKVLQFFVWERAVVLTMSLRGGRLLRETGIAR
jgi:hypothetical protein